MNCCRKMMFLRKLAKKEGNLKVLTNNIYRGRLMHLLLVILMIKCAVRFVVVINNMFNLPKQSP